MRYTFAKTERLCGQTYITQLYHEGKHFVVWPLRITYLPAHDDNTQVLIWASKTLFRHATDRNRLRRQMREAYRLNKHILSDADKSYQLAINYIDKQHQDYTVIHKAMQRALTRLTQTTTNEP